MEVEETDEVCLVLLGFVQCPLRELLRLCALERLIAGVCFCAWVRPGRIAIPFIIPGAIKVDARTEMETGRLAVLAP